MIWRDNPDPFASEAPSPSVPDEVPHHNTPPIDVNAAAAFGSDEPLQLAQLIDDDIDLDDFAGMETEEDRSGKRRRGDSEPGDPVICIARPKVAASPIRPAIAPILARSASAAPSSSSNIDIAGILSRTLAATQRFNEKITSDDCQSLLSDFARREDNRSLIAKIANRSGVSTSKKQS
jgi:hypothetical protein